MCANPTQRFDFILSFQAMPDSQSEILSFQRVEDLMVNHQFLFQRAHSSPTVYIQCIAAKISMDLTPLSSDQKDGHQKKACVRVGVTYRSMEALEFV